MTATIEPACIWSIGAELGEGPVWSGGVLWFVDIKQHQIHRFDPDCTARESYAAPAAPGFVAPLHTGLFIAGLKSGLYTFNPLNGSFALRHLVEADRPGNRLNDSAVDARGRLWFGSMDDGELQPSGRLYRLDDTGPCAMDDGYVITNGPAFSPDGRVLYHTDTLRRTIYAFDLSTDGEISGKRVFVRIEASAGYPDGPVVDADACLWVGLFAGWSARRYSPRGELLKTVRFPCANITKLAFGGPSLTTVYATTAWKGLSAEERARQPLAGGLFSFEADVPGQPQGEVLHG
jgi:xylono-1,5-lactonase